MSKADGRQARAIQGLAAALQECLDSAAESGARRVSKEIRDGIRNEFRDEIQAEFGPRFDRQDETMHLMWRQCGGDPDRRLPVDD